MKTDRLPRRLLFLAIILVAMILPLRGWTWNLEGHRVIASLALLDLPDATRKQIEELLGEPALSGLPAYASWADAIAKERPESRPWHYVNIPMRAESFDRERDCPNDACLVAAVERQVKRLGDPTLSVSERREALLFLVHFIADLHQPLHCGDGTDRGGNDTVVEVDGVRTNLHRVWDGELFTWPSELGEMVSALTKIPMIEEPWDDQSVIRWVNESHRLAVEEIYGRLPKARPDHTVVLPQTELDRVWQISKDRFKLAGARLAVLLQAALRSR